MQAFTVAEGESSPCVFCLYPRKEASVFAFVGVPEKSNSGVRVRKSSN
jgi:hypothetical protein